MHFAFDETTTELIAKLEAFMDEAVYPAEAEAAEQIEALYAEDRWDPPAVLDGLKEQARERGLWNFFLAGHPEEGGLTNLQYAPLAEITGRSIQLAPAALNCAAPDTGNMEVLTMFGTPEQKEQWLRPLLDGQIRSAFAMTEPDVASSDATNIGLSIVRDGDEYVINGRKWWTTGALDPRCEILILMGKTDPAAETHRQQSMVLVPMDTPGVTVERSLPVFGYHDQHGHGEITFDNARIPTSNLIGEEGAGFAIAQARLGPGRIHHCMRMIGLAERALDMMIDRSRERVAFGKPLSDQGVVRESIALSRIEIDQARLLTLKAAALIDSVGAKAARTEIAAIKVVAPRVACDVIDRAIQVHGGAGVSDDTPLAAMYAGARSLRLADGPDEVHLRDIARQELRRQ